MPLLIGGATTSRAHTALKIDPHYKSPTVWVKDASRAVGVAQSLISTDLRAPFVAANDADYAEIRERHTQSRRRQAPGVAGEGARRSASTAAGTTTRRRRRSSPGMHVFDDYPLAELVDVHRLDAVLQHLGTGGQATRRSSTTTVVGAQASELFRDAQAMLKRIVDEKWLTAKAVFGLWPANSVGDDVDRRRRRRADHACTSCASRPTSRSSARTSASPTSSRRRTRGKQDWIGALRRHRRHRHRAARRALRGRPRRLQRDPAQGAGRPPRRGAAPSACTSACARNSGATPPTRRSTTRR